MTPEDRDALISYRLDRATESVDAAQLLLNSGMLASAMNRIYYSMFYAVQALLVLRDVSFSKHGKVKGYFNREFIKTGILPVELGRLYNKAFEYRQKFDYVDFTAPNAALVVDYIEKAKVFIDHIEAHIASSTST
jgi:uncharacterized protein (UPF0332 family)